MLEKKLAQGVVGMVETWLHTLRTEHTGRFHGVEVGRTGEVVDVNVQDTELEPEPEPVDSCRNSKVSEEGNHFHE